MNKDKIKITEDNVLTEEKEKILNLQRQLDEYKVLSRENRKTAKYWQLQYSRKNEELENALAMQKKPRRLKIKSRRSTKTSESVAVLIAGDWHVEEVIQPESVNFLNEYNLQIAQKRIKRYFQKALKLINIQRQATKIDYLVWAWLGDFMSGFIHEDLRETNDLSPTETILWLIPRFKAGIEYFLKEGGFRKIIIPGCIGNHGRTTVYSRIKTAHKNSYEWLMYHVIASHFQDDKRVEFSFPQSYHVYSDVLGYKIRFHHGDWLRYQGGIGGLHIPVNKAINEWDKSNKAYIDVFGHWHQTNDNGSWISSGSLMGYSEFSIKIKGRYEKPSQLLFFVEKDMGKTGVFPIFL